MPTPADSLIVGLQEWYPSPTMNLVCNSKSRAFRAAQLAVATLVLTVGCDSGGGDESGGSTDLSTSGATDPSTSDATPTTTDETPTSSESGSSDETGTETLVDYMTQIQPIWDMRCVTGCHIESGIAQTDGPILTAAQSYMDLVNAASPTVPGIDEVEPGDVDKSYLWHKLLNTQSNVSGLGAQMPLGGMLPQAELDLIKLWIEQGANP